MDAKIQKEYTLILGTNQEGISIEDLDKQAFNFEQLGNVSLSVRVHIVDK